MSYNLTVTYDEARSACEMHTDRGTTPQRLGACTAVGLSKTQPTWSGTSDQYADAINAYARSQGVKGSQAGPSDRQTTGVDTTVNPAQWQGHADPSANAPPKSIVAPAAWAGRPSDGSVGNAIVGGIESYFITSAVASVAVVGIVFYGLYRLTRG